MSLPHSDHANMRRSAPASLKEHSTKNDIVKGDVVKLMPTLKAYAVVLTRNQADADDLVQDTLFKALNNISSFTPGTRLRAWLFTILRNTFYNAAAKTKRERSRAADYACFYPASEEASQEWSIRIKELVQVVRNLPPHYRDTIVLVLVMGESYEKAADICGCKIGTIKSRVNRARAMVSDQMDEAA